MDFGLTKPALSEDQGQGIDPSSGLPVQLPPIIKFFKNAALRGHQAALDEMMNVQPSTSSVDGTIQPTPELRVTGRDYQAPDPAVGPPQLPAPADVGSDPQSSPTVGTVTPQAKPSPKFVQPSLAQTSHDANGLPTPINPAETKLGKLVHILAAAGQGALAGWGQMNPGAGAAAAREIPIQQAQQRQQIQSGGLENQQRAAMLRMLPMDVATRQAALKQQQLQTDILQHGAHGSVYTQGPNGELQYTPTDAYGRPMAPIPGVVSPFMMKPHLEAKAGYDRVTGQPISGNFDRLTGKYYDPDTGQEIQNFQPFEGAMVPKNTVKSESTDLMGNTTSRSTVAPAAGGQVPVSGGRKPPQAVSGAGSMTTGGVSGAQQPSAPKIPPARSGGSGTQGKGGLAGPAGAALPADVEQRLSASGLKPTEQSYIRGLLNYQGQMPSPRAKNYASTLATLTQLDPNFNAANYDANKKTFMDYTPGGSVGKQAIAFNTAIAHLNMLDQAADALHNQDWQAVNRIANSLKVQAGKSPVTTFKAIADAVNGEVSKTFKGTATEGELSRVGANFDSSLSPEQIKNNIRATVGLLGGKMGEMESAYQRQIGRPKNMISPDAQNGINRLMASYEVHAPDGKTVTGYVVNNKYVPVIQ